MKRLCRTSCLWNELGKISTALMVLWVVLAGSFFGAVWLVSDEPGEAVMRHGRESMELLDAEGVYNHKFGSGLMQKDNFTDALIITGSAVDFSEGRLDEALACPTIYYDSERGGSPVGGGLEIFEENKGECRQTGWYYGRYWHGYKVLVRPLLQWFNLKGIRMLSYCFQYILFGFAVWHTARRCGGKISLAFVLSFLLTGFPVIPDTIQFSTVYILTLLSVIFCLCVKRKQLTPVFAGCILFITGAITSFFDLLTTPVMTLGFPLVIVMIRRRRLPDYKVLAICSFCWCAGYSGLWATKWLLASMLTGHDIFGDAILQASLRSSASLLNMPSGSAGVKHIAVLSCILLGVLFVLACWKMAKGKNRVVCRRAFPFCLIAVLPVVWMLLMQNHSIDHFWFVWRIMSVFVFSAGTYLVLVSQAKSGQDAVLNIKY